MSVAACLAGPPCANKPHMLWFSPYLLSQDKAEMSTLPESGEANTHIRRGWVGPSWLNALKAAQVPTEDAPCKHVPITAHMSLGPTRGCPLLLERQDTIPNQLQKGSWGCLVDTPTHIPVPKFKPRPLPSVQLPDDTDKEGSQQGELDRATISQLSSADPAPLLTRSPPAH